MVLYAGVCASLSVCAKVRPNADAFRIPFAPVLSIVGITIALALMTGLKRRELFLMGVTALVSINWL